ncbi:vesicle-fusing ATPase 2 [Drosophila gunungcola]|uniref:Vesicle-fusing ATPase n=1 Tax=Drosophila gunungcola TaxID=103775 RepID=A0A9P9YXQ1_9MUSC|nr:vesicle-fusing ATPase 2 [Drosophila gunungcola]KAI8044624.1 hypothetical protein M5D96_000795 [Drosophila gunungcola]
MVKITLPNQEERRELLASRIKNLSNYYKIADNVCPLEMATRTKNFTEDELCELVHRAASEACARVSSTNGDPDGEGLQVMLEDFLNALKGLVPRFGVQRDNLEQIMPNGFLYYRENKKRDELIDFPIEGLFCQLIEGDPKSGLSTVAAKMALESGIPFARHISAADLMDLGESAKIHYIQNVLEDAYVSRRSCVIFDDLERILDYGALGMRYSNAILQMLMVLLKKQPPRGHGLVILCTSNRRDVLQQLGMMPVFTAVHHVPNLSTPADIMAVMESSKRFEPEEMGHIKDAMEGRHISMGIKRLLDLMTWVSPLKPDRRAAKFLQKMGEAMGWGQH